MFRICIAWCFGGRCSREEVTLATAAGRFVCPMKADATEYGWAGLIAAQALNAAFIYYNNAPGHDGQSRCHSRFNTARVDYDHCCIHGGYMATSISLEHRP